MTPEQRDYWRRREERWAQQDKPSEAQTRHRLAEIYRDIQAELEQQIEAWYGRYAAQTGMTLLEAKKYLNSTDMKHYARLAKKYVELAQQDLENNSTANAARIFSAKANAEMKRYNTEMKINRLKMLESQLRLREMHLSGLVHGETEKALLDRAEQTYQRQAGILGKTVLPDQAGYANDLVNASFQGATFSERIWGPHQQALHSALMDALQQGLVLGKGPAEIIRTLPKSLQSSRYNTFRLVDTELARVQTGAQIQTLKAGGFDEYEFITSIGCCPECRELDGKTFPISEEMPGLNSPPMHPFCRCSIAAAMNEEAYEQWLDQYPQTHIPYDEWKDKYYVPGKSEAKSDLTFSDLEPLSGALSNEERQELFETLKGAPITTRSSYKLLRDLKSISRTGATENSQYVPARNTLTFGTGYASKYPGIGKYSPLGHEFHHFLDGKGRFEGLDHKELDALTAKIPATRVMLKPVASNSDQFLEAVRKDREHLFDEVAAGRKDWLTNTFYDELKGSDSTSGVQDALDAFMDAQAAGQVKWGHGKSYWDRRYNKFKAIKQHPALKSVYQDLGFPVKNQGQVRLESRTYEAASEIWANVGSAVSVGGPELEAVKKYLPNSYQAYTEIMRRLRNE